MTGILVYLSALVVFVGIRSLRLGFRPEGMVYPDYGLSSLAFHGGTCLLLLRLLLFNLNEISIDILSQENQV